MTGRRTSATSSGGATSSTATASPGLHRILTGLDRDSIEMREVSPMGGLLTQEQRSEALAMAG